MQWRLLSKKSELVKCTVDIRILEHGDLQDKSS